MPRSLRARLTIWNLAVVAIALAVFATLLYASLARLLNSHHDDELESKALELTVLLADVRSPADIASALVAEGNGAALVLVRDSTGRMLHRSPALAAAEPGVGEHEALVHAASKGRTEAQFFTVRLNSVGTTRFICVPVPNPPGLFLQVGQPIGDVSETLRFVLTASAVLLPIVLALTSFGGLAIARRALAPMERMGKTLETIQAEDLSRRIDVHAREIELARLAATINRLLDRLGRAFASLREFAGDASHQLQTPLTVMRGSIDLALSAPRDPATYRETLEHIATEVDTIAAMLTDLRALSLADAPVSSSTAPVPLSEVMAQAADLIVALGEGADERVDVSIEPGLAVRGDPVRLQQVVLNLGENAVKYCRPGDRIEIALTREGNDAVLRVSDSGIGIREEDLSHIFDRFYRSSRTAHRSEGAGLGLAIVRRIVEAHGGTIDARSGAAGGALFTVRLPLAPS